MFEKDVQRDDDPFLPSNNDVMRDEFDEHEAEFERWKETIGPMFHARLLAAAAALVGNKRAKEFYEATLFEAFCWTHAEPI